MTSGAEMGFQYDVIARAESPQPRLLVVDEDETQLALVARTLSHHYTVQTEADVFRALVALEEDGPFALIISDLRTGGFDGIEFLERALEAMPDTPRVLVLNDADLVDAIEAVNRARVDGLVTKPVDTIQLLRRVDELIAESGESLDEAEWVVAQVDQPVALAKG